MDAAGMKGKTGCRNYPACRKSSFQKTSSRKHFQLHGHAITTTPQLRTIPFFNWQVWYHTPNFESIPNRKVLQFRPVALFVELFPAVVAFETKVPTAFLPLPHDSLFGALHPTICRRSPRPDGRIPCVRPVAQNENMIRTDSQDYEADEILFHPFALAPTVQRAACALPFGGSLQES